MILLRCRSSIITALLLLSSGDIQTNPGPCKLLNLRNLTLGSFNSRSAVNKAANIHHRRSHRTGWGGPDPPTFGIVTLDPPNFWDSNMGPPMGTPTGPPQNFSHGLPVRPPLEWLPPSKLHQLPPESSNLETSSTTPSSKSGRKTPSTTPPSNLETSSTTPPPSKSGRILDKYGKVLIHY